VVAVLGSVGQRLSQRPQRAGSARRSASQPSSRAPLQSARPSLHAVMAQAPAVHRAVAARGADPVGAHGSHGAVVVRGALDAEVPGGVAAAREGHPGVPHGASGAALVAAAARDAEPVVRVAVLRGGAAVAGDRALHAAPAGGVTHRRRGVPAVRVRSAPPRGVARGVSVYDGVPRGVVGGVRGVRSVGVRGVHPGGGRVLGGGGVRAEVRTSGVRGVGGVRAHVPEAPEEPQKAHRQRPPHAPAWHRG
jgi:hypothetical protein